MDTPLTAMIEVEFRRMAMRVALTHERQLWDLYADAYMPYGEEIEDACKWLMEHPDEIAALPPVEITHNGKVVHRMHLNPFWTQK